MQQQSLAITLCVVILALLASVSFQQKPPSIIGPPIPSLNDALVLPPQLPTPAAVIVDVWIDLTCSDSAELWTGFYKDLIQTVTDQKMPVQFRLHNYPLPYHFAAFEVLKAYLLINDLQKKNRANNGRNYVYDFVNESFENQSPLLHVDDLNTKEIQEMIYDTFLSPLKIPISKSDFLTKMNTREVWDHGRRVFKLATNNGVFGTPQFFINGVAVYNADTFGYQDWMNLLKSLIANA